LNILQAIDDPHLFAPWFRDAGTWTAWRVFLCALFGLPMSDAELELFARCTGRSTPPVAASSEAWLICGRRSGKSVTLALIAVFLATFRSYADCLAPGERATVMVIASDRRQSRVIMRYVQGLLRSVPMLAATIENERAEGIDLEGNVTIEIHTASFRTVRGYTIVAALCDEIAFWPTENSVSPDTEILDALRPAMSTVSGGMLLCASSPYARKGALYDAHRRYYGKDENILVWQAPTRTMNSTVPQRVIDEAMERDPASAAAEYGAEFRTDVESYISLEVIRGCISASCRERQPQSSVRYVAFCDPSGGSADSMTLGIAHKEGQIAILDLLREVKPPFSPEAVCSEFADTMRRYRISRVVGDHYAGEWPRQQFRKHGVTYEPSGRTKSDLYRELLPLLNCRNVDLLDHDKMVSQLVGLERRVGRNGKDYIDHGPGNCHDDIANVTAGALMLASVIRGDGKEKREKLPPQPDIGSFYDRRAGFDPGTRWMLGPYHR
jgi:hypothetical protein